ncbi:unnamed protein product, partial [Closterium sp. NIES-54]
YGFTEMVKAMCTYQQQQQLMYIHASPWIGISCNESTDRSRGKHLVVFATFMKERAVVTWETEFLALLTIHKCDVGSLFAVLLSYLDNIGIDLQQIVAVSTDGVGVMIGSQSGLVVRLLASPCWPSRRPAVRASHCWQPHRPALPAHRPALPSLSRPAARTGLLRAALLLPALLRAALLAGALLPARRPAGSRTAAHTALPAPPCCCPPCCAPPYWPPPCPGCAPLFPRRAPPLPALRASLVLARRPA